MKWKTLLKAMFKEDSEGRFTVSDAYDSREFDKILHDSAKHTERSQITVDRFPHKHTSSGHQYYETDYGFSVCLQCKVKVQPKVHKEITGKSASGY